LVGYEKFIESIMIMKTENHFLEEFFNPQSVAIVGASNNPVKMSFRPLNNLYSQNFKGRVYPVNPGVKEILGYKAFGSLGEIPDRIDLVVSLVPAEKTFGIVKDCNKVGVKNLVIITGGFSEGGKKSKALHHEIEYYAKKRGIRILGPNTLSPVNTVNNFVISFSQVKALRKGGLSFAFQSGFYEPKINWMFSHLGINKILDMGNKMDINEVDALEYFSLDPETKIIAMHIESLHGDGRIFFKLLKSVSQKKPVIILKSGRTRAGSIAAASHTGSISRENDSIFNSAIEQAGAIRAQNSAEFFDLAKGFQFLDLPKGNRLAIITLSGGEGVMATDACEMNGFTLAELEDSTYQRLKKLFPPWEIPVNPFDAGVCMQFPNADFETFFETVFAIPEDKNVDCMIKQMFPATFAERSTAASSSESKAKSDSNPYIQKLLEIKKSGKPFALWRSSMDSAEMEFIEMLEDKCLPVFETSERAIRVLAALYKFKLRTV